MKYEHVTFQSKHNLLLKVWNWYQFGNTATVSMCSSRLESAAGHSVSSDTVSRESKLYCCFIDFIDQPAGLQSSLKKELLKRVSVGLKEVLANYLMTSERQQCLAQADLHFGQRNAHLDRTYGQELKENFEELLTSVEEAIFLSWVSRFEGTGHH